MFMRQMTNLLCTDPSLQDMYPLFKLASIAALIPVSTADCERSFSTMNRVKTKLRNRMTTSTLDSLIRISKEGPRLLQFNFEGPPTFGLPYVTEDFRLEYYQIHLFLPNSNTQTPFLFT